MNLKIKQPNQRPSRKKLRELHKEKVIQRKFEAISLGNLLADNWLKFHNQRSNKNV